MPSKDTVIILKEKFTVFLGVMTTNFLRFGIKIVSGAEDSEKMKEALNKKGFSRFLLVLLLLASSFYWFQWRPTRIRHDCSWVQKSRTQNQFDWDKDVPIGTKVDFWAPASEEEYKFCIRENGITR